MGRWRRKEHKHRKKVFENESEHTSITGQSSSASSPTNLTGMDQETLVDGNIKFTILEQEQLYEYLLEYKRLAEQHCNLSADSSSTSGEIRELLISSSYCSVDTAFGSASSDEAPPTTKSNTNNDDPNAEDCLTIRGHVFPSLTVDLVSSKPYLAMPKSLNNKHRQCLHVLCVEAGLFHASIGSHPYDRYIVISPFPKGFDCLLKSGQLKPPACIPVKECKPWFYRTHHQTSFYYYRMQMSVIDVNKKIDEIATESFSHLDNIVSWHFSRKRSAIIIADPVEKSRIRIDNDELIDFKDDSSTPKSNNSFFFRGQKPCASKNILDADTLVQTVTKVAEEKIWELIDQPSKCIRDSFDDFDFQYLSMQDLSTLVPLGLDATSCLLVNTKETMLQCIQEIEESDPDVIGFDLEMYNPNAHTCITCLLQIATSSASYVIDVLVPEVWQLVSLLAPIFADPNVVKVGQAIGSLDVPSLHRDFGIFVVNAFDTYEAAWLLKLQKKGLSSLCEYYGLPNSISKEYHRLKKSYQMTDWRKRPLSPSMIRYGRFDVHYLIALRTLMIRDLTRGDLWDDELNETGTKERKNAEASLVSKTIKTMLQRSETEYLEDSDDTRSVNNTSQGSISAEDGYFTAVEEDAVDSVNDAINGDIARGLRMNANVMKVITESQQRCLSFWKGKKEHIKIRQEYTFLGSWSFHHSRLCETLDDWRRRIASIEGTMPGLVISTDFLIDIARHRPTSYNKLRRLSYFLPQLLQDEHSEYALQLLQIIRSFEHVENKPDTLIRDNLINDVAPSNSSPREGKNAAQIQASIEVVDQVEEKSVDILSSLPSNVAECGSSSDSQDKHIEATETDPPNEISLYYLVNFVAFFTIGAAVVVLWSKRKTR